eukprot:9845326-Alexandrium_andersonii.AAC.1
MGRLVDFAIRGGKDGALGAQDIVTYGDSIDPRLMYECRAIMCELFGSKHIHAATHGLAWART